MIENSRKAAQDGDTLADFAAHVAHDFNNLLTGILGNLELVQSRARRNGIDGLDGYLESARHAGNRAALFARRLLVLSGHAAQGNAAVAVNALIEDIAAPWQARGARVALELSPDPARVFCDPGLAEFALEELLENAAEATAAAGGITVGTEIRGGLVCIRVRDTGTGMTPEILARAEEAFFTTRPNGASKGLGLTIAGRFARQSGGMLELASTQGQGSVVSLRLPVLPLE